MIVNESNFKEVIDTLCRPGLLLGVDTETTGLRWYDRDRLFSTIIADSDTAYYFNFNEESFYSNGDEVDPSYILPRSYLSALQPIFSNTSSTFFMHNAKFDMGMLSREGLSIKGDVHCTQAIARLISSEHHSYSLENCLKRMNTDLGTPVIFKSDKVKEYIAKHKLTTTYRVPGKKKAMVQPHYDRVPLDVIAPYGEIDAVATLKIGMYQLRKLETMGAYSPKLESLYRTECDLTKELFKSEVCGFPIDLEKTKTLYDKDQTKLALAIEKFNYTVSLPFIDSGKALAAIFDELGQKYGFTEKGTPCFDKAALKAMNTPLGNLILEIRASAKRITSYFSSFLMFATGKGKIHCSYVQGGTATGRMSVRDPAMQTIPKVNADSIDDDLSEAKLVRSCFTPREGECLFMPDFDQMEYRMMLDQAEEMDLIRLVQNGLDVHTATAELVGVSRQEAKTINFMLLYGGGAQKLADALGITRIKAMGIKAKYFAKLPRVKSWISGKIKRLENSIHPSGLGYNINTFGRMTFLEKSFAYKTPNYEIQGSTADVVKRAIVEIGDFLEAGDYKTALLLQVHDELIYSIPKDELHLAPHIVDIMENAYQYKHLKLTAGASYSWTNWGNKKEGFPQIGKTTGNSIQGKDI